MRNSLRRPVWWGAVTAVTVLVAGGLVWGAMSFPTRAHARFFPARAHASGPPESSTAAPPVTAAPTGPPVTAASTGVHDWGEVTYGSDGYLARTCSGLSSEMQYEVFSPSSPGPHPIVFGITGTGFAGSAGCDPQTGTEVYRAFDPVMARWVRAGFVAVNIEYHGYGDGLYGDVTYPGSGRWGTTADATTELDIKPAMKFFLSHDPARYGAGEQMGIVVFGASSGAHDAYMAGVTGLPGHGIAAVVGWSGLPDAQAAGTYPESVFDQYMRTTPGTDVEAFGDPFHRLGRSDPPQYVANGLHEFISPTNAEDYVAHCERVKVRACWLRLPDTAAHAQGYATYRLSGLLPEKTAPPATPGTTVLADSIAFAKRYVQGAR